MPPNYSVIDKFVSRSAQPKIEDFNWLKERGVTDVVNFRTMIKAAIDFDEQTVVEELGMRYHSIPSVTKAPTDTNIKSFLNIINNIVKDNGKAHIHCMAGADRTGMYSFIYKMLNGIGNLSENKTEWLVMGHNNVRYPDLMNWTEDFVKNFHK